MVADVQIAFQGGGARLADLLVVAEALQQEEEHRRILITRVAGTSAGAIAAAVTACGGDSAAQTRKYLTKHSARLINMISGGQTLPLKVRTWSNVWRVVTGRPLLSPDGLSKAIYEMFEALILPRLQAMDGKNATFRRPGQITFGDLRKIGGKELFVVSADLKTRRAEVESADDSDLIKALVDSCALPFAFRGYGILEHNSRVDGGLCVNLPSDILLEKEGGTGEVLAVSFAEKPGQAFAPNGLLEYLQALVGTAINASVVRAADRLRPDATLAISSSLSTFSFAEAFGSPSPDSGLGSVKNQQNWFDP